MIFKHLYLKGALKRLKEGKPNWKDLYYNELFRCQKDFTESDLTTLSISSSLFPYILKNYEKTIEDKRSYFCLYTECGAFNNFYWLLFCLKCLDINSITFPDLSTKDLFLSKLDKEIGDGYYPIRLIDGEMEVVNAIPKTFYGEMFGKFSY